jgi:hypothetical protein
MLPHLKNIHYAASNSNFSIGALLSEDMMWTPPPYQRRTRPDLLQEPCHDEKGINDDLSSEDRAAAAPRPAHYQDYYFPDHGSRSGNDGDENSTTPR